MRKRIIIDNTEIFYTLARRKGARRLSLRVRRSGELVLSVPKFCPMYFAKSFLEKNVGWISESLKKFKDRNINEPANDPLKSYSHCKARARKLIHERVKKYNEIYNFSFNKISIKDHWTRWGSCSTKKNLNFNYRLVFLPLHLVDYVVVHELCHLKEMNHSHKFWSLVSRAVPDYRKKRLMLKRNARDCITTA